MSILIKNVEVSGKRQDIGIIGNRIAAMGCGLSGDYDIQLDGSHLMAAAPFYNTHTHAAMSLLRSYADDMELFEWLTKYIWPAEQKLTGDDIYWGTRLACLEMVKSGTVFFCDMYFWPMEVARAAADSGLRAAVAPTTLSCSPQAEQYRRQSEEAWERRAELDPKVQLMTAPHAVYTCTEKDLRELAEFSARENIRLTIHVAETSKEVSDCMEAHGGMTPVAYLDSLGVLSERTIAAHCIYLSDEDRKIFAQRGVYSAFNPCSNMKLCSGMFPFRKMMDDGCRVTIGTDGCASNNNLSMFDEMKMAALVAKMSSQTPTGATAGEIYHAATRAGAEAFGIDAGIIEPGRLADIMLLDSDAPQMVPNFNPVSNLVYSADAGCVKTVICDGRILMQDRVVPGEEEVIAHARECAAKLTR